MKHLRQIKGTYLLLTLLWLLAGVALLLFPAISSELICTGLGILCLIYGIVKIVGYFSKDPYKLAFQFDLALGILCLVLALVLIFFQKGILSLLPTIVGIFTVVSGVFKLQTALEARRFGMNKWWGLLALSIITILLGLLLLIHPFKAAMLVVRIMGLALIFGAVEDLATTAYMVRPPKQDDIIDVDDFWEV